MLKRGMKWFSRVSHLISTLLRLRFNAVIGIDPSIQLGKLFSIQKSGYASITRTEGISYPSGQNSGIFLRYTQKQNSPHLNQSLESTIGLLSSYELRLISQLKYELGYLPQVMWVLSLMCFSAAFTLWFASYV